MASFSSLSYGLPILTIGSGPRGVTPDQIRVPASAPPKTSRNPFQIRRSGNPQLVMKS